MLRALGYPELSLGDAHKARLLVKAAKLEDSILGNQVALTVGMKIWMLFTTDPAYAKWSQIINASGELRGRVNEMLSKLELQFWAEIMEGLIAANCCAEYLQLSKEALALFPEDAVFASEVANAESWMLQRISATAELDLEPARLETTLCNGGVYPTGYPWMLEETLTRSSKIVDSLKIEFKAASRNAIVARSMIQDQDPSARVEMSEATHDILGVIALQNIPEGETILMDSTAAGVVSKSDRCPLCCGPILDNVAAVCCSVIFCSEGCAGIAPLSYHKALCNKDFSFLTCAAQSAVDTTDFALDSLLFLRLLAMAISEQVAHPLQSSLLARLTPFYTQIQPLAFSFQHHIVNPVRTLQALNIDPFQDLRYDTWVLHTIRCRMQNNKHGHYLDGLPGSAVSPLYSMFNHSCEPNVAWEHGKRADGSVDVMGQSSTLRMFAVRDIKEGEELLISYLPKDMDYIERRESLRSWWDGDCGCVKCAREKI